MKHFISFFLLVLVFISCDKNNASTNFNDQGQSTAWANQIESDIEAYQTASNILNTEFNKTDFLNESNRENLRTLFANTINAFAKIEEYNVASIRSNFLLIGLASHPIDSNLIAQTLADNNFLFSLENVNKLGSRAKGLYAIEYLLFADINTSAPTKEDYLKALAQLNNNSANNLMQNWTENLVSTQEDVSTSFSGFRAQMLNANLALLEDITNQRLGVPFGFADGGFTQQQKAHLFISQLSLQNIKSSLAAFKQYNIDGEYSTAAWLKARGTNGAENAEILIERFEFVEEALLNVSGNSLVDAINNQNIEILSVYERLKILLTHYKIFVIPSLSVTVTFSDNDGD